MSNNYVGARCCCNVERTISDELTQGQLIFLVNDIFIVCIYILMLNMFFDIFLHLL